MLRYLFKLVFRTAEQRPFQAEGRQGGPRIDEARSKCERPTTEFLAQVLKKALAQKNAESRGGRTVQKTPNEPLEDAEQPDGKVVRFVPKPRPEPDRVSEPRRPTDEDDPGPRAA